MASSAATAPPCKPLAEIRLLLTTVGSREQALQLAHAAVEARLAACVQLQAVESVYRWQGAVQQETEWRLLLKTDAQHADALQALLRAQHPYTLPALLSLPAGASVEFSDWVAGELAP